MSRRAMRFYGTNRGRAMWVYGMRGRATSVYGIMWGRAKRVY